MDILLIEVSAQRGDAQALQDRVSDQAPERWPVFELAEGRGGSAFGREHDVADSRGAQHGLDAGCAVAAIGGHRSARTAGTLLDPSDRRFQHWRVGGLPISTVRPDSKFSR